MGSIIEPLYTQFLALVNAFRLHIPYCINNVMKFMFKYKKCNIEKYKLCCVAELINGTRCAAQTSQTMFLMQTTDKHNVLEPAEKIGVSLEAWALFENIVVSEIEQKTILQFEPLKITNFLLNCCPDMKKSLPLI